mmetsp:Transcript_10527/g.32386  ORF Transcript_10527/g.32386 Transcript_10527/m.32386 type:complete len:570 (+) Transcript_10527:693-2402(+)
MVEGFDAVFANYPDAQARATVWATNMGFRSVGEIQELGPTWINNLADAADVLPGIRTLLTKRAREWTGEPACKAARTEAAAPTPSSAAPDPTPTALVWGLPVGARVQLQGLSNQSYNGKCGVVVGPHGERVKVLLDGQSSPLSFKPSNLKLIVERLPYEDEPKSIFDGEDHSRRCAALRIARPRPTMPCVRAATATLGIRLARRGCPWELRREIYAMAFALPDDATRRAEAARDASLVVGEYIVPLEVDPPLIKGGLERAVFAALAGAPGLTDVARSGEFAFLSDASEAYDLGGVVCGPDGPPDLAFFTLFPFEAQFPAIVGIETLTIRSTCARCGETCVGGAVRSLDDRDAVFTGKFSLPPVERTFTAPRAFWRGPGADGAVLHGDHWTVSDLAKAITFLPASWRDITRRHGLLAFDYRSREGYDLDLSFGRFKFPSGSLDSEDLSFAPCSLRTDFGRDNIKFRLVDQDHGVLDVKWDLLTNGSHESCSHEFSHGCAFACESLSWEVTDVNNQNLLESWDYRNHDESDEDDDAGPARSLMQLRKACVDREQWQESFEEEVSSDGAVIA